MKLFAPILLGLTEAGDHRQTVEMARDTFGNSSRVCGMMSGEYGHMAETMLLDAGESCIYRIKPTRGAPEDSHLHIRLIEAAEVDCNEVQLHVVTNNGNGPEVMGPYCYETQEDGSRHRRGAYSSDTGMDYASKEVDMVYTRTNGGGFRFAFNFEFEFELLPGLPGAAAQSGYAEQMGSYGKPSYGKPAYGSDNDKPKPAPSKPASKPPPKPTYGGDNEKPKPSYQKPTQAPYKPKPTEYKPKPTTEKPKPTPYKPKPTEYKPKPPKPTEYKPKPPKPTEYKPKPTEYKPPPPKPTEYKPKPTPTPYKPTPKPTEYKPKPPKPTEYKPAPTKPGYKPGKPSKPVFYKPVAGCPWETNHGYSTYAGDCPGHENKCNLKYFRVCGESFFNKVYNDVCKWQDAKQLIPMFTEKLVPLGAKFENKFGVKCNGLNKEGKSLQELFGGALPTTERDVPQCKPIAGAVPCELINFHGVTHARQFHHKVEALYHEYLIHHCNKEWQVHFEALLKRMRNSLFCDDGGHPDHDGYVVSPPPPTYGSKPKPPTPAPYKPKPPKPTEYKPKPPKPTEYKPPPKPPVTPTPYKPVTKPVTKPPYKPVTKPPPKPPVTPYKPITKPPPKPPVTPYKPPVTKPPVTKPPVTPYKPNPPKPKPTQYGGNNNTPKPYKPPIFKPNANCPWEKPGNYASYPGDCPGHNGLCNLKYFRVCGETFFNKVYNDVCHWQDAAQLIPMITKKLVPLGAQFEKKNTVKCNGLNKEEKSLQDLFGGVIPEGDRDVPQCKPIAGAVPCKYIDFSGITTARQFHHRIVDLYHGFLKQHCNKEWQVHFEALLKRMRNSLFCDDGGMPDHEGYVVSPPPPVYKPTPPPSPPKPKPTYAASKPAYPQKPPVEYPGHYTSHAGPLETTFYCPWNKFNYNGNEYSNDCGNGKCSLKFSRRCLNNLFNKVYQNICAWQEAIKLMEDITGFLTELGVKVQSSSGDKCKNNINKYQSGQRSMYIDVEFTHDSENYFTDTLPEDRKRRQADVREVPSCKLSAGYIPCGKFNFHQAKDELEFYHMVKELVAFVGKSCNNEWNNRMDSFVLRLKNSLTCEGGLQPDH